MKFLSENRGEYIREVLELEPYSIATFSKINNIEILNLPLKVLMNKDAFDKQEILSDKWDIRINGKTHLKLAIGRGVFI